MLGCRDWIADLQRLGACFHELDQNPVLARRERSQKLAVMKESRIRGNDAAASAHD
jgi:hypothetical protein